MESRLVPLNALLSLVIADGLNPAPLAEAGLELVGLEIPCSTTEGTVVIDAVLASPTLGHLLACEAKCGNNIEVPQARRYAALDARTVVRSAFVTLRQRAEPTLEVVYVGLAENKERMLLGLTAAGVEFPLITASQLQIVLENRAPASELLRHALATPVSLAGPPASCIPFDQDSGVESILPHVRAALTAALAQHMPQVSITSLTERAAPHYALYSTSAQGRLRRKVSQAARSVAAETPETFEYHDAHGNRDAFVKFLHSPEENDPRGRTQGYQRLARTAQRTRRPRPEIPGQGSLLDELDKAESGDETEPTEEKEGDEI